MLLSLTTTSSNLHFLCTDSFFHFCEITLKNSTIEKFYQFQFKSPPKQALRVGILQRLLRKGYSGLQSVWVVLSLQFVKYSWNFKYNIVLSYVSSHLTVGLFKEYWIVLIIGMIPRNQLFRKQNKYFALRILSQSGHNFLFWFTTNMYIICIISKPWMVAPIHGFAKYARQETTRYI